MPAPSSDAIDKAADQLRARLAELNDERRRLERALNALTGAGARRGPGRPPGSGRGRGVRRRRRRRGGTRAEQAAKVVKDNPGATVSEIAQRLRIKPNYVYRVMNELQKDRVVRKKGKGYVPA
jgi:winged helix-turn-helix DNA-binding protein